MTKKVIIALLALLASSSFSMSMATPKTTSGIQVEKAWIRVLPGNLPAAGYAVLKNTRDKDYHLTAAHSAYYQHIQLHQSIDGHMKAVEHLLIPSHKQVKLAPGGYHLMLMHAEKDIKVGESIPVTLEFADQPAVTIQFKVRPANSTKNTGHMNHMDMNHMDMNHMDMNHMDMSHMGMGHMDGSNQD